MQQLQTQSDLLEHLLQQANIFYTLVQHLVVKYKTHLQYNNFKSAPKVVWDELHNSVRFCSTVVSRRMTFEHAYKLASETLLAHLTFAENLCNSEHAAHIWRIRFCDNKRFATIDDLNNY